MKGNCIDNIIEAISYFQKEVKNSSKKVCKINRAEAEIIFKEYAKVINTEYTMDDYLCYLLIGNYDRYYLKEAAERAIYRFVGEKWQYDNGDEN